MALKRQLKLNCYLAIVYAVLLMTGETIRRYGEWGHWSRWADDYLMGLFLIIPAFLILKGQRFGVPILLAGWGFNAGLLYGSFFSKVTADANSFQTNIEPNLLIILIGLAFFTSILAMFWLIVIEIKHEY